MEGGGLGLGGVFVCVNTCACSNCLASKFLMDWLVIIGSLNKSAKVSKHVIKVLHIALVYVDLKDTCSSQAISPVEPKGNTSKRKGVLPSWVYVHTFRTDLLTGRAFMIGSYIIVRHCLGGFYVI